MTTGVNLFGYPQKKYRRYLEMRRQENEARYARKAAGLELIAAGEKSALDIAIILKCGLRTVQRWKHTRVDRYKLPKPYSPAFEKLPRQTMR